MYSHEGDPYDGGVVEAGYEAYAPANAAPVDRDVEYAPFALHADGVVVERSYGIRRW